MKNYFFITLKRRTNSLDYRELKMLFNDISIVAVFFAQFPWNSTATVNCLLTDCWLPYLM